jgi:hypothetical protein
MYVIIMEKKIIDDFNDDTTARPGNMQVLAELWCAGWESFGLGFAATPSAIVGVRPRAGYVAAYAASESRWVAWGHYGAHLADDQSFL